MRARLYAPLRPLTIALVAACLALAGCTRGGNAPAALNVEPGTVLTGRNALGDWTTDAPGVRRRITTADLPAPSATPAVDNGAKLVPAPAGAWPKAPPGFVVELFADNLTNPRKIVTAPNGDCFVAESKANRVKVLRPGADGKPAATEIFADKLNRPFGIAFYPPGPNPTHVYVGNTDAVVRFPYQNGDLRARAAAEEIAELPAGGQLRGGGHWTRDVVFTPDGKRMFVSVGSHSNNDDTPQEKHRAAVLQYDPDGRNFRLFATGLRNAVGLAIQPKTGDLWASVNERDGLGDDLVPDYVTRVRAGAFYGWPWFYIGNHPDPKHAGKRPELAGQVVVPDVLLQSHSASLCMTFYDGQQFPAEFKGHAFAAEHGSWNRSRRTGYKVVRIPVRDGNATGEYEDFLTGFVTPQGDVWGRPVGVTVAADGSLLISDDGGNRIWRVRYAGPRG